MDWKQDLLAAVDEVLKLPDGGDRAEWKCLGKVIPAAEQGWYSLDLRTGRHSRGPGTADSFDQLCLADKEGPEAGAHIPIERTVLADGVLRVKVAGPLPRGADWAWTIRLTPHHLMKRLREGIAAIDRAPLAAKLAAGVLDPVPAATHAPPPSFRPGQVAAYNACLAPGLHAVWGPPGTGKTTVLSRAIETLVAAGKRVLLVSTANIAVDNALRQVIGMLKPRPGQVLRVGPPHLAELAANDDIQLHRLAARTTVETDAELADVQAALAELDTADRRIAELDALLDGYVHSAYLAAGERVTRTRRWEAVREELAGARQRFAAANDAVGSAAAAVDAAAAEVHRTMPARQALADAHRHQADVARLELELQARNAEVRRLRSTPLPRGPLRKRRAIKQLRQVVDSHPAYEAATLDHIAKLRSLAGLRARDAGPVTTDTLRHLDAALTAARERLAAASPAASALLHRVREWESEEGNLLAAGLATDEDQRLLDDARRRGLPEAHERRVRFHALREQGAAKRGELEDRLRKLNATIAKLRKDAEGEIVAGAQVVGTTLARSRAHRAVAEQEFDVVIVDEAGAAILAEVVLAVAGARRTAVLLGDFLQLPPVVGKAVQEHAREAVRRWMVPDSFTHCGIRTPRDAERNAGCAVLTDQFRFGPNLQRLANDVLYRVLADGRKAVSGRAAPDTTLVLVDVSEMGELNTIHRKGAIAGWWPIGALLSRALAQHHATDPGGVGVVTTFREQAEATLSAMRDSEVDHGIPVGTAHAFQGREFDTVVFDLVEDGRGWISKARAGHTPFAYDGVRLFGVGITRARQRLYLIADLERAVKPATGQTPLGLVNALGAKNVQLCRAGTLLGLGEGPKPRPVSRVEQELAEVLREYIQVNEINDDFAFNEALARHLKGVRRSLWMWSPWVGNRSKHFLPLIADAVRRGVDTHVYIRTERDKLLMRDSNRAWVEELIATGARVIRAQMEHKKVVVLDEQTVLLGQPQPAVAERHPRRHDHHSRQGVRRPTADRTRRTRLQHPARLHEVRARN
ncbi:AAA domain-containing protein [Actinokineospora sp. G85]|uniref:AAA domain-containing protein n=1 Tax=Actinokineospora sp. G85 TaxID=3406626 RepID=UPI003C706CC4